MTTQLLSIQPEELTFQFDLEKQSFCNLKVANTTGHHVAFKVKTTSPRKYFVRPNAGIILPGDSRVITVTMQAQREYPPDMHCKDKFLLQGTIVSPSANPDEIPQDAFNKDGEKTIDEYKLRVVYTLPPSLGNSGEQSFLSPSNPMPKSSRLHSETNSMHSSSSFEDIQVLTQLKEEKDAVIKQHQQLQQELETLKRHISRESNTGFSFIFAAFAGVVGVVVGLILNIALSPSKQL